MASINGKTALVTGASSGIGKATVEELLSAGAKVYGAARRVDKMEDLQAKGARVRAIDVTKEDSMVSGIKAILEQEGSVDILVNNAGYGSYGAVEDVPLEEARRQFEVNIFGLARLTQLVLPKMREKRYGKIVNISSMGGKVYTSFGGWYHATKHALEGLSDCLRLETAPFGIDVIIIEPGGIATPWGIIAGENLRETSGQGAYAGLANKAADALIKRYSSNQLTSPAVIAQTILKALTAGRPKTRYAVGYMAKPALWMRHWLSDRMFDFLIKTMGS